MSDKKLGFLTMYFSERIERMVLWSASGTLPIGAVLVVYVPVIGNVRVVLVLVAIFSLLTTTFRKPTCSTKARKSVSGMVRPFH